MELRYTKKLQGIEMMGRLRLPWLVVEVCTVQEPLLPCPSQPRSRPVMTDPIPAPMLLSPTPPRHRREWAGKVMGWCK